MVIFPSNSSKKSLKKWLDFSYKKGLQLWSDLLKFQAATKLKNGWICQIEMNCNYGQISFQIQAKRSLKNDGFI